MCEVCSLSTSFPMCDSVHGDFHERCVLCLSVALPRAESNDASECHVHVYRHLQGS